MISMSALLFRNGKQIARQVSGADCSWTTSFDSENGTERDKGAPKKRTDSETPYPRRRKKDVPMSLA